MGKGIILWELMEGVKTVHLEFPGNEDLFLLQLLFS